MSIPKVFISYSHDSQEHKKWVLDLATRLINTGINIILDQWELKPGVDIPHFMETHLSDSDYIIMICTDKYVQKANEGSGGVGYEKMMITAEVMKGIESTKVIPIIKQEGTRNVPTFLQSKFSLNLSRTDSFEFNYDELIRTVHGAPLYVKPEIGNNPFVPVENLVIEKTNDSIKQLMAIIVREFEKSTFDFISYDYILKSVHISRIMLDMIISDTIKEGLITQDSSKYVYLTDKGKHYAIEHAIIK